MVVEEEADSAKAYTSKRSPMSTTSTTGKTSQTREEHLAEGGAIMWEEANKITPSSAIWWQI